MMPRPLPARETPPAYPAYMEDARQTLATTVACLAKLQLRVYRKLKSARKHDNGVWEMAPRWVLAELEPPPLGSMAPLPVCRWRTSSTTLWRPSCI